MYDSLKKRIENGEPILLDGANGTELVRRGVRWRKHGLQTEPESVQELHQDYLKAGADVIRTNTFQLNPRIYLSIFRDAEHQAHIGAPGLAELTPELYRTSVRVAKEARKNTGKEDSAAIAGVLSPLEHCFRPDIAPSGDEARKEHGELAQIFSDEGVDFILLESMNTVGEARAALEAGRTAGLPVWVSFVLGPEGELLSREPLADAVKAMESGGADAVLVNCVPTADISPALTKLKQATGKPIGGFAHIGKFSPPSWKFDFFPQFVETDSCPPDRYCQEAKQWRENGATILGGCCGTGPAHVKALRDWLGERS